MQYFLGLTAFTSKPVMDPSLLVYIRKRIDLKVFETLTDELIRQELQIQDKKPLDPENEVEQDEEDDIDSKEVDDNEESENKGKLQLDATVAPHLSQESQKRLSECIQEKAQGRKRTSQSLKTTTSICQARHTTY